LHPARRSHEPLSPQRTLLTQLLDQELRLNAVPDLQGLRHKFFVMVRRLRATRLAALRPPAIRVGWKEKCRIHLTVHTPNDGRIRRHVV
jgi:hypothetical protein